VTGNHTVREPVLPSNTDAEPTLTTGSVVAGAADELINETAPIDAATNTTRNRR
jgi:hypothetical protein